MEGRIKGTIWDFGMVLGSFDHMRACNRLAGYSALSPDEIFKQLFVGEDAPEELHESGQLISIGFFFEACWRARIQGLCFQEFCDIWKDIFSENEGVSELIGRIGAKMCICSNTDPIHWTQIERLQVIKKHFSDPAMYVRSYTSLARKPDPKMFRDALKCLGLPASSVLYIEDTEEYRRAFEQMGGNVLPYDCSKDPISTLGDGLARWGLI